MSVSGISAQNLAVYQAQQAQQTQQARSGRTQLQQEFQQLGQDLQSGNLSGAQADFSTLQQIAPGGSTAATTSSNSISQEFTQLGQDLKSGNLSAAQQDYSKVQQDYQSAHGTHHYHHHGGGGSSDQVNQLFQQLGQELQSGSLSTAQQSYSTLQQDLMFNQSNGLFSAQPTTPSISATA